MNIITLVQNIAYAVHDDSPTQTWATAQYGRNQYVYIGVDSRHPPNKDKYPLVHVYPADELAGYERTSQDHIVSVSCGVHDDDLKTVVGKANLIYYESVNMLVAFYRLVRVAVTGADIGALRIDSIETEFDPITMFPFLIARMDVKIVHDYVQGDDPFS